MKRPSTRKIAIAGALALVSTTALAQGLLIRNNPAPNTDRRDGRRSMARAMMIGKLNAYTVR